MKNTDVSYNKCFGLVTQPLSGAEAAFDTNLSTLICK